MPNEESKPASLAKHRCRRGDSLLQRFDVLKAEQKDNRVE
jgi:hypothetical protein